MPHEKWERIEEIFLQGADVPPLERAALLDRMGGGDTEIRREVESLLRADATGESAVCAALESEVASMLNESSLVDTRLGPYEQVVCERDVIAPSEVVRRDNEKLAPRLRGDLDTIVQRAMHKEPSRRYETVERLAEDIRRYLSDEPITARPDNFVYRSRKFIRRNRLALRVGLAVLLAFGAGFLFSIELRHRLLPSRTTWADLPLSTDNQVGSRLQRVELLVVLGDSYARDHNWKDALRAYQQAQAQIPSNLTTDDPALQVWRDRISAGIALGQEQQRMNEKK